MGEAGGVLCSTLTHPPLFPGQRSREEQAAGKEGQQTSLGTEGTFSMEENSLYSSRGKGRHQELGKVLPSLICLHVFHSGVSPPFARRLGRFYTGEQLLPWRRCAGGAVESLLVKQPLPALWFGRAGFHCAIALLPCSRSLRALIVQTPLPHCCGKSRTHSTALGWEMQLCSLHVFNAALLHPQAAWSRRLR